MLCPHCETENQDEATTCSNCGADLSDSSLVTSSAQSEPDADPKTDTDSTTATDISVEQTVRITSTEEANAKDTSNTEGTFNTEDTEENAITEDASETDPESSPSESAAEDMVEPVAESAVDSPSKSEIEPEVESAAELAMDPTMLMPAVTPIFLEDDFDSTASQQKLSPDIDYTQFKVVTEGADIPDVHKTPVSSKAIKIATIAVLAVVLCIAVGGGLWSLVTSQQSNAKKAEVQKLEESYKSQVDSIDVSPTEDSDRTELLASYKDLADIQSKIDADKAAGKFKLLDGNDDPDLMVVTSSITDKEKKIVDWFSSDYKKRLAASSFDGSDSADTLDQTTIDARISGLKSLQADIENEKIIWGGNTGKGSNYSSYVNRITEQIARGNKLSKELQKKAQAKAEQDKKDAEKNSKPDKKAQDRWVGTYAGMGTDGLKLEIVLNSDGTVVYREDETKVTTGTWTGDENSVKISFGGKVSSASEPFTITSSNGGRRIAVSSQNAAWHTDYLEKQ